MACSLSLLLRERNLSADPGEVPASLQSTIYSSSSLIARLSPQIRLESHQGCVNCINFSESGRLLASGSDDLHIILWDWEKGKKLAKFESKHVANVFQAKFMPQTNDSVLVSASRDGQVRRHVISSSGELVATDKVAYHSDSAHKLAIEPDNPYVFLSCGEDGSVLEIDLREDMPQRNKILVCKNGKNRRLPLYSIFIDPSNYNNFAVSGRDQYARVYDRRRLATSRTEAAASSSKNYEPIQKFCPSHLELPESEFQKANITCLVYSYDGKELLCSYNDEDIYTFNATVDCNGEYVKKFEGHRNNATVKGVNYFGLKSEYVVSGSDCGHVFLWDKNSTKIVQFFEGDNEGVVNCLEPHPQSPILAVSGLDHNIKICAPYSSELMDTDHLKEVMSHNVEERKESETIDGLQSYDFLLDFILHQARRRRAGLEEVDSDSSSSFSDEESFEERNIDGEEEEGVGGEGEEEEGERERGSGGRGSGGGGRRQIIWRFPVRRRRRREEGEDSDSSDAEPINCAQS